MRALRVIRPCVGQRRLKKGSLPCRQRVISAYQLGGTLSQEDLIGVYTTYYNNSAAHFPRWRQGNK